jgi:hypothetical protein
MIYFRAPRCHLALCNRDLVLLDELNGAYSLLAGAADYVRETADDHLEITQPELAGALVQAGALRTTPLDRPRLSLSPPTVSALALPAVSRQHLPVSLLVATTLDAPLAYGRCDFGRLLARARRQAPAAHPPDHCDEALIGLAQTFDAVSPWIPWPGECLFRSTMLLRRLAPRGYRPRWVFGVRTWPFAAHCWLQAGPVALTDYADTLRPFTPILAL